MILSGVERPLIQSCQEKLGTDMVAPCAKLSGLQAAAHLCGLPLGLDNRRNEAVRPAFLPVFPAFLQLELLCEGETPHPVLLDQ